MALRKKIFEDKIEVVGDYKTIQVRTATIVEEGTASSGYTELSRSFHRHTLDCVSSVQDEDGNWTHTDTDVSEESTEVQGIASTVWTEEVKTAKKLANESASL